MQWRIQVLISTALLMGGCCKCDTKKAAQASPRPEANDESLVEGVEHFVGADTPKSKAEGPLAAAPSLSRNNVNLTDKNLLTSWSVEEGKQKNIKWTAQIGDRGYCNAVVSGGKVFVSTNNANPRDPKVKGDKAVIYCFKEGDGSFLWQSLHDMSPPIIDQQGAHDGMCSAPAIDGDFLYFVTPGCKVTCASVKDGKPVWQYDLMKELKVSPCILNACSPLIVGDLVYVNTGNGHNGQEFPSPKAPSFVAINKKTGALAWQNNAPGANVLHGQWGNLAYAEVNGKGQVICPSGDGYLYGLDALNGETIWKFKCNPFKPDSREAKDLTKRNFLVATPVIHGNRAYIGAGAGPETGYGNSISHFWCIDITKKGDVSCPEYDFDPKSPKNKDSALVWHFGAEGKGDRKAVFGQTLSSAVVHDGMVYIPEETGYFHCLDAADGKQLWESDFKTEVWGSPLFVDGKIYAGASDGTIYIFAHGRQEKLIAKMEMDESVQSTPVVANGVLYVVTKSKVYAIAAK